MTNTDRLIMEVKGIELTVNEIIVYLEEEDIFDPNSEYEPTSNMNKRKTYSAALTILNSVANNPKLMKAYKTDDITVSDFAVSLSNRIDQLERKIRMMAVSDYINSNSSTFMLFNS